MRPGGGNRKGKDWERAWARMLQERGFDARRGLQSRDGGDAPDVLSDAGIWWECKASGSTYRNVLDALDQANIASSCVLGRPRLPVAVPIKVDGYKPFVAMPAADFLDLLVRLRDAEAAGKVNWEACDG